MPTKRAQGVNIFEFFKHTKADWLESKTKFWASIASQLKKTAHCTSPPQPFLEQHMI